MHRPQITLIFLLTAFGVNGLAAGEINSGKAKVASVCQTCHGMDGVGNIAGVPNLSGQKKDYLTIQLEAYRSGRREHQQMSIIAQMLSDEDIDNVTEWYSSIKITLELPE